ncbi:MAG: zinc-binding alcohol dehydrogenase family protein, partial [Rhodococcus sp. (in: high G+C Gram-positive bacteria)]|nr:zinc-binding alcohol dehydrogenase family protein [Rhodococcus sp. (in: high G+C Gram-positive bacteria)]
MSALIVSHGPTAADSAFTEVERSLPLIRPRDLLVRVEAVSVNPVDTKRRAGLSAGQTG